MDKENAAQSSDDDIQIIQEVVSENNAPLERDFATDEESNEEVEEEEEVENDDDENGERIQIQIKAENRDEVKGAESKTEEVTGEVTSDEEKKTAEVDPPQPGPSRRLSNSVPANRSTSFLAKEREIDFRNVSVLDKAVPPADHPRTTMMTKSQQLTSFLKMKQFMRENYILPSMASTDFAIRKFTDAYVSMLHAARDLRPVLPDSRVPEELIAAIRPRLNFFLNHKRPKGPVPKAEIINLSSDEEEEPETTAAKKPKVDNDADEEQTTADKEDEGEAEIDEDVELDDGTDYAQNYFDNGEDYLESEHDGEDEGPVY